MNRVSFGSKSLGPINSPWANVLAELDHSEEIIFFCNTLTFFGGGGAADQEWFWKAGGAY